MRTDWLAWTCCLLPLFVVHLAYVINVHGGQVEACNPYWSGCTSISRAARSGDGLYLFRITMLPYVVGLLGFWQLHAAWATSQSPSAAPLRLMFARYLGMSGALFLALYICFLGEDGDTARWLRRYGITLFFGLTVLAQMLAVSSMAGLGVSNVMRRWLVALCLLLLCLGLASIPLQHLVADRDAALNRIEWVYSVLMLGYYAGVALIWRRQRFVLRPEVSPR